MLNYNMITKMLKMTLHAFSFILSKTLVLLRLLFCAFHHLYGYPSVLLWILLLWPLSWVRPKLFWYIFHVLSEFLITMGTWYSWSAGYGVVEMGDDISPCLHDRTLVLLNHQTVGDIVVLLNILLSRPHIIPESMWIMGEEIKYIPFGILSAARKDFFIPIGKDRREEGLLQFKKHLKQWYLPAQKKLIFLFPEGGFLYKRRANSQKYALQHNLPVLQHVCLPRLGAMQAVLDVCTAGPTDSAMINGSKDSNSELKWVLDVTIAYPRGIPLCLATLGTAARDPFNTIVVYRLFPASQVPSEPSQMADWLYSRWQEKEDILTKFYTTGEISVGDICSNPVTPRLLTQNRLQHMFTHLFCILSSYLFYKIISLFLAPSTLIVIIIVYSTFVGLKSGKVI